MPRCMLEPIQAFSQKTHSVLFHHQSLVIESYINLFLKLTIEENNFCIILLKFHFSLAIGRSFFYLFGQNSFPLPQLMNSFMSSLIVACSFIRGWTTAQITKSRNFLVAIVFSCPLTSFLVKYFHSNKLLCLSSF